MNEFIPPSKLKPCPECGEEMVYIKAGTDKQSGLYEYEAYYKCPNDCYQKHGFRRYKIWFRAKDAYKHLKS